ncbi:spore cortex biosynthesis protein YabQ [Paenibacillus psychroresistens]|uniref:Spore cortex biosynthesis protein YabQ n=1 Tax=Paenibacillus psychroresistens TaxID=1778678 RepID=A0A6B8REB3_9BACL|nr:spore cortex biosynthesis protein YabQ [Paenibacillus psychroresistens]
MNLNHQFLTMALMIGCGLGLGVFFDIYRVLTDKLKLSRWIISILDIMYGLIAAVAVFRVLYYSNYGQLRFFIFVALILGIYLYYKWFSKLVIQFVFNLIKGLEWLWNLLIVRPVQLFYSILTIFFGFFKVLTIFFYKLMLQLSYPLQFLTRRLIRIIQRLFHLS